MADRVDDEDRDDDGVRAKHPKSKKNISGALALILIIVGVAAVFLIVVVVGAVAAAIYFWPSPPQVAKGPVDAIPPGKMPPGAPNLGPPPAAGPAVNATAPEIDGVDQDGKSFKLSDYKGKVVLLDFWSQL
jgi:cytochrome oxidase Cu insertion factor (SCO1/SenC/PrrC family)